MKRRASANLLTLWLAVLPGALPAQAGLVKVIEYAGDHLFLTANPWEIESLDSGAIAGWRRTGVELWVHDAPEPGLVPVCRFYSVAFAPRSAHFYTADAAECEAVKANPHWIDEGVAFYAKPPEQQYPGSWDCPSGYRGVTRWYNGGSGGAPRHIFHPYGAYWDYWDGRPPMGWTVESVADWGVAFCTAFTGNIGEELRKLREGREAFFSNSVWDLSVAVEGTGEIELRLTFLNAGGGRAIGRLGNLDPSVEAPPVWFWYFPDEYRFVEGAYYGPAVSLAAGKTRLEQIYLHYVGSDRVEGGACIARRPSEPQEASLVRSCHAVVGHRQ